MYRLEAAPAPRSTHFDRVPPSLRDFWLKVLYCPPPWAVFLNPYYIVRRGLYTSIRRGAAQARGRVLDFGAGSAPYRHLFGCEEYVTVDTEAGGYPASRKIESVRYDGQSLPFPEKHFDFILCSEVLEHVFNLEQIIGELQRVLKPGGHLLISTPFVWEEHERPYDFARYTCFAWQYLLDRHGLDALSIEKTGGYIPTLCQMGVVYLANRRVFARSRFLKLFAAATVFAGIQLIGLALDSLLPRDDRLCLNIVLLAKKRSLEPPCRPSSSR